MNVMTFLWQVEFDVGEILLWQVKSRRNPTVAGKKQRVYHLISPWQVTKLYSQLILGKSRNLVIF